MRNQHNLQGMKLGINQVYTRIARTIRSRRTIAIGFAGSLMLSQLCISCKDTSESDYSVKMMGSCRQQTSIRIVDETRGLAPNARVDAKPEDSAFKNYVNTISKYVFTRVDEMGQCHENGYDNPQVELVFIYRPITYCKVPPFNFERTQSNDSKHLDSPWVKLSMSKSSKLIVRAAFIWNERQLLFDQAVLSDPQTVSPIQPLLPLSGDVYSQFLDNYKSYTQKYEYVGQEREADKVFQAKKAAAIAKLNLPPDIMWLFDRTGGFLSGTSNIVGTIHYVGDKRRVSYINLTKTLLNLRFASEQKEQSYQRVLDLKDVFNIDKYRIKSPRKDKGEKS
jgi:hypothetical protein